MPNFSNGNKFTKLNVQIKEVVQYKIIIKHHDIYFKVTVVIPETDLKVDVLK